MAVFLQPKAWTEGSALGLSRKAKETAETGQSKEEGFATKGTVTVRCPIWMVLLHLTLIYMQSPENTKSDLVNILAGSKVVPEAGRRWALRNKPKNATKQIAQKEAYLLLFKLRRDRIPSSNEIVIGSRGLGGTPRVLWMPRITEVTTQLSDKGLGIPYHGVVDHQNQDRSR